MKCANCNEEDFDALLTLFEGVGRNDVKHADGWCLDCIKKWVYAHRWIKVDNLKIEYHCHECEKQLFPQNAVTYVYRVYGTKYNDSGGEWCDWFLCREHERDWLRYKQNHNSDYKDVEITRYTRQMHIQALEKLRQEKWKEAWK